MFKNSRKKMTCVYGVPGDESHARISPQKRHYLKKLVRDLPYHLPVGKHS